MTAWRRSSLVSFYTDDECSKLATKVQVYPFTATHTTSVLTDNLFFLGGGTRNI